MILTARDFLSHTKGLTMYDLAKSIQTDKRRHACEHRRTANVSATRSFSFGRYRLTVDRQANIGARLI